MIFVDTGAWISVFDVGDLYDSAGTSWFTANDETLVTSDYVVDETLTLLWARN